MVWGDMQLKEHMIDENYSALEAFGYLAWTGYPYTDAFGSICRRWMDTGSN